MVMTLLLIACFRYVRKCTRLRGRENRVCPNFGAFFKYLIYTEPGARRWMSSLGGDDDPYTASKRDVVTQTQPSN
jgi:hypothetical protein